MTELNTPLLMFISQRYAENRILEALAADGVEMTLAQGRVAARIGEDGTRLTELAEAAQITKQSAGFLVDQLERAGYVERVPDPTDARARLVCLTDKAREVQRSARREEQAIEREWAAHLGAEQMRALRSALEALREVTDPYR